MDIYGFLQEHEIEFERYDHPAVFTCEEAEIHVPSMPAAKTKNLFVRDRKGRRHFLVVVGYEKQVNLAALSEVLGVKKLSIASTQRLQGASGRRSRVGDDSGLSQRRGPEGRARSRSTHRRSRLGTLSPFGQHSYAVPEFPGP